MENFFKSNPGFRPRIAHRVEFPDYSDDEPGQIAAHMLDAPGYRPTKAAERALPDYVEARRGQPHFANARSIRSAPDRARLRQANRLSEAESGPLDADALGTIDEADIRASRVFAGGLAHERESRE